MHSCILKGVRNYAINNALALHSLILAVSVITQCITKTRTMASCDHGLW